MTKAVEGLVQALKAIGGPDEAGECPVCGLWPPYCDEAEFEEPCDECRGRIARAALEAFAQRSPLRDDVALFNAITSAVLATFPDALYSKRAFVATVALDAVDASLGPRGAGKGEG